MLSRAIKATLLATLASSVLAADQLQTPLIWECDAPGTGGFYLSDNDVSFDDAADACAEHGGVLADLSNANFLFASDMVRNCIGENENAWIRSWDYSHTNPQERRCLAIYVGFSGPGGGIDLDCDGSRYALCRTGGKRQHAITNGGNGFAYNAPKTITVTETVNFQPTQETATTEEPAQETPDQPPMLQAPAPVEEPEPTQSMYYVTFGAPVAQTTNQITITDATTTQTPFVFNYSFMDQDESFSASPSFSI